MIKVKANPHRFDNISEEKGSELYRKCVGAAKMALTCVSASVTDADGEVDSALVQSTLLITMARFAGATSGLTAEEYWSTLVSDSREFFVSEFNEGKRMMAEFEEKMNAEARKPPYSNS